MDSGGCYSFADRKAFERGEKLMERINLSAAASRTMGMAGKSIRDELRRGYDSPDEASAAIREAALDQDRLESWATLVSNDSQIFRFADLPTPMRDVAKQSIAAAMLAWELQQQRNAGRSR